MTKKKTKRVGGIDGWIYPTEDGVDDMLNPYAHVVWTEHDERGIMKDYGVPGVVIRRDHYSDAGKVVLGTPMYYEHGSADPVPATIDDDGGVWIEVDDED